MFILNHASLSLHHIQGPVEYAFNLLITLSDNSFFHHLPKIILHISSVTIETIASKN